MVPDALVQAITDIGNGAVDHLTTLVAHLVGEDDTIKVVVPAVRQGVAGWLANDQEAFDQAERVADASAAKLPGETADAAVGEADVGLAVRDALATFPADEIVVAVRPDEQEEYVESAATDTAPEHDIDGVPVRYVVISDERLSGEKPG